MKNMYLFSTIYYNSVHTYNNILKKRYLELNNAIESSILEPEETAITLFNTIEVKMDRFCTDIQILK